MKKLDDSQEFRIRGMDCAEEVALLKREIGPVVGGVDRLVFDILKGKMTVLAGTSSVDSKLVIDSVQRTGMRAEPWVPLGTGTFLAGRTIGYGTTRSSGRKTRSMPAGHMIAWRKKNTSTRRP